MELVELCQELRNWFCSDENKKINDYTITDGEITPSIDIAVGQYYRIVGSVFNDGVYKHGEEDIIDETFRGGIWLMSVPNAVLELLDRITAYEEKYGDELNSPFQSESFGGYSYNRKSGSNGNAYSSVFDAFKSELNRWRKL